MIRYTVDVEGRATDVTVIEAQPAGIMEDALRTAYRRSMYRPRFVDGAPVATEDLLSRHNFKYAGAAPVQPKDDDDLPEPTQDRGRLERPGG